jgi:SAM-dependent methyltransferase
MKADSEKVSFIVGDAEHLPLRNDIFDIVFCKDLLHHVSNSVYAALEMRRVAKKNGNVVALEANGFNPQMILIGLIYFSVDKGVFKNTKARLIAIFTGAGLASVSAVETEFLPRHVLFEYRSPLSRLSVSNLKFILRIMYKMENNLQNSSIIKRFANYIIVQGVKEV